MTMEDVWKDISLASLCDHSSPAAAAAAPGSSSTTRNDPSAYRGFVFQDFMAAASTKVAPSSSLATDLAPPPATLLSLSSSGSDHFQQYQVQKSTATTSTNTTTAPPIVLVKPNPQTVDSDSTRPSSSLISFSNKSALEGLDSSPYCKKRAVDETGESSKHVRHRRMIKNRESASRSRARKQAYTSELELKIEQLREENARLKRQQEKFCLATTPRPVAPASTPKRAHSV